MTEAIKTISARLNDALELWREAGGIGGKKAFAELMQKRFAASPSGQRGISYQTILSYFDGTYTPTLEWLAQAADVLGVRLQWLALQDGPRTEAELHALLESMRKPHPVVNRMKDALTEEFPLYRYVQGSSSDTLLMGLLTRRFHTRILTTEDEDHAVATARAVGRAFNAVISHLEINTSELRLGDLQAYIALMVQAVSVVGPKGPIWESSDIQLKNIHPFPPLNIPSDSDQQSEPGTAKRASQKKVAATKSGRLSR